MKKLVLLFTAAVLFICSIAFITKSLPGSTLHIAKVVGAVQDLQLATIDDNSGDWLTYGRNYGEERFSPLGQITKDNVSQLGLAWSLNLGTKRGIEGTPLVVDGIMFLSGPWSVVYAIDVRKGKILWTYDPQVPKGFGEKACCDVVNRGLAMYKGNIFVGTLDGRLVSINAATGKKKWEVLSVSHDRSYTITGAPRVMDGKVIIGNSGAEYGVRGYVTAYDAMTGKKIWRFFTVPGNPANGFEHPEMKEAAKTWNGEWWKYGGGGTAWDAFAYDPKLKLIYVGTGNGSPWNREIRSPGGGDNLYLSSILAIHAETGKLKWHYQTTPGDSWDFTAVQQIILTQLEIKGKKREVLMQAPKNGFFYVLDRNTGELLSAEPYVYVNWASKVDIKTGRPVENPNARYVKSNEQIYPSPFGGHNWQAMAFNPKTNLVYIPAREQSWNFGNQIDFVYDKDHWSTGNKSNPANPTNKDPNGPKSYGKLIAWDPVLNKEVWHKAEKTGWNSGVLTTSDLVFQGNAEGDFNALDARTGKVLWTKNLGTGIVAPPITYLVDGVQYVTIAVGWGGVMGLSSRSTEQINPGTVYTFAIGKNVAMPVYEKEPKKEYLTLPVEISDEQVAKGASLFGKYCGPCHNLNAGNPGGNIPNLTYSHPDIMGAFQQIVGDGIFLPKGMPKFGGRLNNDDISNIKGYILATAKKNREKK
ncbi:PQQ-dependent dehydrogenase, methanol/ethanol family [Aquirufa sp. HETE-40SA]